MGLLGSSLAMKTSEECLKNAEDCERQGAACGPGSSRDTLLATAAQWRRMAEVAASAEALGLPSRNEQEQGTRPNGPASSAGRFIKTGQLGLRHRAFVLGEALLFELLDRLFAPG